MRALAGVEHLPGVGQGMVGEVDAAEPGSAIRDAGERRDADAAGPQLPVEEAEVELQVVAAEHRVAGEGEEAAVNGATQIRAGVVRPEVVIPLEGGRSTLVAVSLQYAPPGGELGHAVATLFGEDAGCQIDDDLRAFKHAVETGRLVAA